MRAYCLRPASETTSARAGSASSSARSSASSSAALVTSPTPATAFALAAVVRRT